MISPQPQARTAGNPPDMLRLEQRLVTEGKGLESHRRRVDKAIFVAYS